MSYCQALQAIHELEGVIINLIRKVKLHIFESSRYPSQSRTYRQDDLTLALALPWNTLCGIYRTIEMKKRDGGSRSLYISQEHSVVFG
jgi:hypothetical protein